MFKRVFRSVQRDYHRNKRRKSLCWGVTGTVQRSLNNNSMSTKIYHASRLRGKVCKLVCHNSAAETVRNFMGTGVYPIHRSTLSSAYFVGMR